MARRDPEAGSLFLIDAAYADSTNKKYIAAASSFYRWLVQHYLDPDTPDGFDRVLTTYLHHLYKTGRGKGKAKDTFAGTLSLLPHLKGQLYLSALSLRGWNKLAPPRSYPPLTLELTFSIALNLTIHGHHRAAIATILAFDCLLRINEFLSLRRDDIADAKDARVSTTTAQMTIRLRKTKTGNNQSVIVRNPIVIYLLRNLIAPLPVSSRSTLFAYTDDQYRRLFKQACSSLQLSGEYVPHSLRHGGATHCFVSGMPMEDILTRGRWKSTSSARTYIQSSRALAMSMKIPKRLDPLPTQDTFLTFFASALRARSSHTK
jgi:integrase